MQKVKLTPEIEKERTAKVKNLESTLNWLVFTIPYDLDRDRKKEKISPQLRAELVERDKGTCQMCGKVGEYGCRNPYNDNPGRHQLHHIIPNGLAEPNNLTTLCLHCHTAVHELLFVLGKWKYTSVR
jgi:5-methylcytosine-specific restriction endonuclease McrA